jgi:hypothetical protein
MPLQATGWAAPPGSALGSGETLRHPLHPHGHGHQRCPRVPRACGPKTTMRYLSQDARTEQAPVVVRVPAFAGPSSVVL